MIRKNILSHNGQDFPGKNNMHTFPGKNRPFLLKPAEKDYLWGGTRLRDDFGKEGLLERDSGKKSLLENDLRKKSSLENDSGKESPLEKISGKGSSSEVLAETWECSTHPDGLSMVVSGQHAGKSLQEVLLECPEYLGKRHRIRDGYENISNPEAGVNPEADNSSENKDNSRQSGELPILIKLIDAKQDLSVQVHPDDAYATEHENGALGKTEMWYVLDAAKDAELVYGLRWDVDKETLRESIQAGTIKKYLQKVKVKTDDVFFVEAGTIHAIGAGTLIAEIQENSNLTYRLYDYDRVDKNGRKRELHVEKALEVANLQSSAEPVQPMRVLKYTRGFASELLCRCRYFQVERVLLNTENYREMVDYHTSSVSFEVLLCIRGCGVLFFEEESLTFGKGDCIFVPADSVKIKLHGNAQMLKIRC